MRLWMNIFDRIAIDIKVYFVKYASRVKYGCAM